MKKRFRGFLERTREYSIVLEREKEREREISSSVENAENAYSFLYPAINFTHSEQTEKNEKTEEVVRNRGRKGEAEK